MRFYTNVTRYKNQILVREYDNGKRKSFRVKYKPYLFLPCQDDSKYHTHLGHPVKKINFNSMWDAYSFLKDNKTIENFKYYGSEDYVYSYIYDNYPTEMEFDFSKIIIANIDIEVGNEHDGFPDVEETLEFITIITIEWNGRYYAFGLGEFDKHELKYIKEDVSPDNIMYYKAVDEIDLLKHFLEFWGKLSPDIITGWNIKGFDIPYLVNRIEKVLGYGSSEKLSPWGILENEVLEKFGKMIKSYKPIGISVLDYIDLYKKFEPTQRESYSLEYIAQYELGKGKVKAKDDENMFSLYKTDFHKYTEYNIYDTSLVRQIDNKMRLLELVAIIALDNKVNFEDALGSVLLWDVITTNYLMDHNIVVPPTKRSPKETILGAYVKPVQPGMHKWVVSFDLRSLYPELIQQYNISPETKIGKHSHHYSIDDFVEGRFSDTEWLKDNNCGITGNCILYSNENKGFFPTLARKVFNKRDTYKKIMQKHERNAETLKQEILRRGLHVE